MLATELLQLLIHIRQYHISVGQPAAAAARCLDAQGQCQQAQLLHQLQLTLLLRGRSHSLAT
jgi:hypothetical protein